MSYDIFNLVQLFRFCPICTSELVQNEKYKRAGAKSCPTHGDFYIGRGEGQEPLVIFKTYATPNKVVRPKWNQGRPGALIRCNETGKLYANQKVIVSTLGVSQGNLSKHLRGDKKFSHLNGYTFSVVDPTSQKKHVL